MFTFRKRGKNHDFAEANEIQKLYLGITFVCTLELTSRPIKLPVNVHVIGHPSSRHLYVYGQVLFSSGSQLR